MTSIHSLISAVMNAAANLLRTPAPGHLLPQHLGQHTNPRANEWRQIKRALGARQARKRKLRNRAADKILADHGVPAPESLPSPFKGD